jgi:hypothetical protein
VSSSIYPGEKQSAIDIQWNYSRGDDVAVICSICESRPDLNKLVKSQGGQTGKPILPNPISSQQKDKRYKAASDDFEEAQRLAIQHGLKLLRFTDMHYQLRDDKLDYVINLYPGNQRIYVDRQHKRPPFLDLSHPWRLQEVVTTLVQKGKEQ